MTTNRAKPRWASISPDKKTILFARNHNLYMMDAPSYELAQKKADDPAILETQLTKDGVEHYSYARRPEPRSGAAAAATAAATAGSAAGRPAERERGGRGHQPERSRAGHYHRLVAGFSQIFDGPARFAESRRPVGHQPADDAAARSSRPTAMRCPAKRTSRSRRSTSSTSPPENGEGQGRPLQGSVAVGRHDARAAGAGGGGRGGGGGGAGQTPMRPSRSG